MRKRLINLSGKRLMAAQLIELEKIGIIEFIEPEEDTKKMFECEKEYSFCEYTEMARKIIETFEIGDNDYIHINGIDINLILSINRLVDATFVYSKMTKVRTDNNKYMTEFVCFVKLIDVEI